MLGTSSPHTASLVAAIVAIRGDRRGPDERTIDRAALAAKLLGSVGDDADDADKGEVDRCLVERADPFTAALSMNIFDARWRRRVLAKRPAETSREGRQPSAEWLSEQLEADAATADESIVLLSTSFVALLDDPLPPAPRSALVPRLDAHGRQDIAMVEAIVGSGAGAHLALRRRAGAWREPDDLAALLGDDERHVVVFGGAEDDYLAAILHAELHAGSAPPLMLIDRDLLTSSKHPESDTWDEPARPKPADAVSALALTISINDDKRIGVTIALKSRRLSSKVDDDLGVYASRNSTARQTPSRSRALPSPRRVTAEMEAAGVRAFLASADTAKLGRALADVFDAIEAADFDYDDDGG